MTAGRAQQVSRGTAPMKLRHSAPALALCTLFAACGGTSSDDTFTAPTMPISELPAAYAAALCEAFENCAGKLFEIYRPGEDCTANVTARLEEELGRIEDAIDAGRVIYRGEYMSACTDDLRARSCDGLIERDPDICKNAIDGTVELGEPCSMSIECKGSAYCNFADACPGVCTARERAGGLCSDDDDCASGLVCSSQTGRCVAPADLGEPCEAGEPECAPGLFCAGADEDESRSGTCRRLDEAFSLGNGEACDVLTGELCDPELVCVVESFGASGIAATCKPKVGSGESCGLAVPDQCPNDEYCQIAEGSLTGTCAPRPGRGEACGPSPFDDEGSVCGANLRCNGGVCREPASLCESCTSDDACSSEHCKDGACVSGASCE